MSGCGGRIVAVGAAAIDELEVQRAAAPRHARATPHLSIAPISDIKPPQMVGARRGDAERHAHRRARYGDLDVARKAPVRVVRVLLVFARPASSFVLRFGEPWARPWSLHVGVGASEQVEQPDRVDRKGSRRWATENQRRSKRFLGLRLALSSQTPRRIGNSRPSLTESNTGSVASRSMFGPSRNRRSTTSRQCNMSLATKTTT
jgi:hypothetical protein